MDTLKQSNIIDALDPDKARCNHCGTYHVKEDIKTDICPDCWQEFKSRQTNDTGIRLTAKDVQYYMTKILEPVE